MTISTVNSILIAALCMFARVRAGALQVQLSPFTAIESNLSFPGRVIASDTGAREVSFSLPQPMIDLLSVEVKGDVLSLLLKSDVSNFSTTEPQNFTLICPRQTLSRVAAYGAGNLAIDGQVLNNSSATIQGAGLVRVAVDNCSTSGVNISVSGSSAVSVLGSMKSVLVSGAGATRTLVSQVTESVKVNLAGGDSLYVSGNSDTTDISGSVFGSASVFYDQGNCRVTRNAMGSACQRQAIDVNAFLNAASAPGGAAQSDSGNGQGNSGTGNGFGNQGTGNGNYNSGNGNGNGNWGSGNGNGNGNGNWGSGNGNGNGNGNWGSGNGNGNGNGNFGSGFGNGYGNGPAWGGYYTSFG